MNTILNESEIIGMEKKRVELLKKLREYVAEGKNIETSYCNDGSYCAVGFLLNECGFDFEQPGFGSFENGSYVQSLYSKLGLNGLEKLFNVEELQELQDINDNETQGTLLSYIDELITASDTE